MNIRVFEIARLAGVTSEEVISRLKNRGEFVRSAASSVAEPVAVRLLEELGVGARSFAGDAAIKKSDGSVLTPATRFTWQANPVKEPKNLRVLEKVAELEAAFEVAAKHRELLQALGSQFVYAEVEKGEDGKQIGFALARFSGAIEAAFGITREVMFFYSPFYDLQIRTFAKAKDCLGRLPREATPDLIFFSAPDDRLALKLEDWSGLGFTAIPLVQSLEPEPIEIVRLLRDHVYARDLFYETTPVRGNRFFGRKALLQELKDDVLQQRVSGIFGLRKSGKTSVLLHFAELVASPRLLPVFVDLEVLPSPPEDPSVAFIVAVATRVQKAIRPLGLNMEDRAVFGPEPTSQGLQDFLGEALAALRQADTRLVLLLDEIEFLTPTDQVDVAEGAFSGVAQALGVLRSLVQEMDNFTFILSGLTSHILESGRLYGRPNPMFSWAKARYIGPFSEVEANELAVAVGARMGIEIEEGALRALYDGSGGHAYLYRNLASAVVAELPVATYRRVIRHSDVLHQLLPWKRSIAGNLEEIFGHLERYYPTESVLLDILMESPEEFSGIAVTEDRAVHHLVSLGLLKESRGRFEASSMLELR